MADLRLETPQLRFDFDGHPGEPIPPIFPGESESFEERVGGDLVFDWSLCPGQYKLDHGLRTAVMLSLFCDARAREDDELPDRDEGPFPDRRGYWADYLSTLGPDDRWGSRLWLLKGQSLTQGTLARARSYCLEALQWLTTEGVATFDVQTSSPRRGVLLIEIEIVDAITRQAKRWRFAWDSMVQGGV